MEEKVGAYKVDADGIIVPDDDDAAMVQRHNLKKEKAEIADASSEKTISEKGGKKHATGK